MGFLDDHTAFWHSTTASQWLLTPLALYGLYHLTISLSAPPKRHDAIIPGPSIDANVNSTPATSSPLPYPPKLIPNGRSIPTPHGCTRVYEFGYPSGPRVLLVHGISTPCISLFSVAVRLSKLGYRVMLFDLYGRGYSSCPAPAQHPQTASLFATQILAVLASSSVSWTGHGKRFRLVGYSLGGGIAADFVSRYPALVESLVLIAPAGLLRDSRIALRSRIVYGGWLPTWAVEWLVRRHLGATEQSSKTPSMTEGDVVDVATAARAEEPDAPSRADHPALAADSTARISEDGPDLSIADVVAWQTRHNSGFVPAFISSLQHAPIQHQHVRWQVIAQRLRQQEEHGRRQGGKSGTDGMIRAKVLMILGSKDEVIDVNETAEDAKDIFGDRMEMQRFNAGHDLPVTASREVADAIVQFWQDAS